MAHSSRGLGRGPLTAETRVRIPVALLKAVVPSNGCFFYFLHSDRFNKNLTFAHKSKIKVNMFSGIVEEAAKVISVEQDKGNIHITMECSFVNELKIDQSVAHNGVCLTVVSKTDKTYTVTAIKETLERSNLGCLKQGSLVNLERSMLMNGRLDGHIVQGHVDQTAVCTDVTEADGSWYYTFHYNFNKEMAQQGTMLDIDFGSYPFVTSSNTTCAGCCTGLGVAPHRIGEVFGIFKAYCTRVGSGPFPTELFDETGDKIGELGHEFGAVTGRKRRCGWIDLVALKYAVMLNGVTQLIMMKSDVLDTFENIKACVAYKINGEEVTEFPYSIDGEIEPIYVELPGWQTDMTKMKSEDEFPEEFNAYLSFLEEELQVPIKIVSVGPDVEVTLTS